jgi:Helix-turn-helix domain
VSVPRLKGSYDAEKLDIDGRRITRLRPPLDSLGAAELAVHRCLLWHLSDETGKCCPSHQTMAAKTGYSVPSVKRALLGLRDKGIWNWEGKADTPGRGRAPNHYQEISVSRRSANQEVKVSDRSDQQLKSARPKAQIGTDQKLRVSEEQQQREQQKERTKKKGLPLSIPETEKQKNREAVERQSNEDELARLEAHLKRKPGDSRTARAIATVRDELGIEVDDLSDLAGAEEVERRLAEQRQRETADAARQENFCDCGGADDGEGSCIACSKPKLAEVAAA